MRYSTPTTSTSSAGSSTASSRTTSRWCRQPLDPGDRRARRAAQGGPPVGADRRSAANVVRLRIGEEGSGHHHRRRRRCRRGARRGGGTVEGEARTVAFNARYLNEALQNLDGDQLSLELNGPLSSGVFRPTDDGLRPRHHARPHAVLGDPCASTT